MKIHRNQNTFLKTTLVLLFSCTSLFAVSVSFRSMPGQNNITSSAAAEIMDDCFIFGVGAFDSGFTPTTGNMAEWADHWTPLGYTGYNAKTKFFAGTANLTNNAAPFTLSNRGYIWGFRCSGGRNEWILVSDPSWTWPYASGLGFPVTWDLSLAANVITGEVNGSSFHMKTSNVGDLSAPDLSPAEWNSVYPTAGGWDSDPDKDGMSNLSEFALGLSPVTANVKEESQPKIVFVDDIDGRYMSVLVNRRQSSYVSLTVEFSSDLIHWATPVSGSSIISNTVLAYQVRDDVLATSQERRFARLKVNLL